MASAAVIAAVDARIAANWTRTPVLGPNKQGQAPADGSAFLTIQYPVANEEHISLGQIGQRTFRENGAIRLVLSVPRGAGGKPWASWMDELRALFRAAQFAGVNCLTASPALLDDNNDDGKYFKLSSIVEYYADILA